MNECRATGCGRKAHGYSKYCSGHMQRVRRHGHLLQRGVSASELAPLKREIHTFLDRRPDDNGWAPTEHFLAAWKENLEGERRAMDRGAHSRFLRQALDGVLAVTRDPSVTSRDLIGTVGAMILLRKRSPSRFANDRGYLAQVSRRFRSLNDDAVATSRNPFRGTSRRYQKDLSDRTVQAIGQTVMTGLGAVLMYAIEQMDAEEAGKAKAITNALTKLSPGALAGNTQTEIMT